MTKGHKIKELRKVINQLNDKIVGQKQHRQYREKQYARTKKEHAHELKRINRCTNAMANTLSYKFVKDLTWLELCDNPESKIHYVKSTIKNLQELAKSVEEER